LRRLSVLVVALCLAGVFPGLLKAMSAQAAANPTPGSHNPASSVPTPAQPPAKQPAKPIAEPIDPNATAGVRGVGFAIKVQVTFKAKPVVGAYVVVRNPNHSVAGTCNTDSTGVCTLSVGAGKYTFTATQNGLAGANFAQVATATKKLVIKLARVK
jgi:hypothetical protein